MKKCDEAMEAQIEGQINSRGCTCMTAVLDPQKSSLKTVICRDCGKKFKTNMDTEYCSDCMKKHK
ncbi:MAG: hypothetical protein MJ209_04960 [archaeon]|nr:hypothetical protein [archaeon]